MAGALTLDVVFNKHIMFSRFGLEPFGLIFKRQGYLGRQYKSLILPMINFSVSPKA